MMTLIMAMMALASSDPKVDRTELALERCLASPAAAPAQQTEDGDEPTEEVQEEQAAPREQSDGRASCLDNARRSYDRRVIGAYRSLLKKASPDAAEWLGRTNQAWLEYRDTMTGDVDVVAAARDHALWLESLRDK